MAGEPEILAVIPKSSTAEVRVVRDIYKGREVIDIRVWWLPEGQTEMVRSKRGVEFKKEKLAPLLEALAKVK
ncbi:MAG: hypothetical protein CML06_21010 [Pseudomonadales bacterium]|uniref:PC4/YdbC family ssDNA-binding protein n=1 Tax=Alteromonas australica TaxID=589873 RepID=UPI000C97BB9A|nr:PC4/YdbC family ssDNA-binding protein [Alteromonas australica]MAR93330.1 hypothetical protein [Pseudomonadales bacterium]